MESGLVYNMLDFGAEPDGKTLNTQAVQQAMNACSEAGGGTVYFPKGIYKAGSLFLRSNITLYPEATATLLQSKDMVDSVEAEEDSHVWLTASRSAFSCGADVEKISIVDQGTIDGNMALRNGHRGPLTFHFQQCKNILLKEKW